MRPLLAPLAFVVLAVPLAVLLDELGFFEVLAHLVGEHRRYLGACWVLAGLVTALLNLDAAVVMLTPLYLRLAERRSVAPLVLAFQPLLLSCLASSALPISNLTNLIAAPSVHLSSFGFLEHLALPTLATTAVGWLAYRRLCGDLAGFPHRGPSGADAGAPRLDQALRPVAAGRPLVVGGVVVCCCVAGFLAVPSVGGAPWEVAAAGDLLLIGLTRRVPWAVVPWRSVGVVLGLGAIAAALARQLDLGGLLAGSSPLDLLRDVGELGAASNAVNNLPALLVTLPHLGRAPSWAAWSALLGANVAPLALPSGTLASLLWLETIRRLGVRFGERDYLRIAWRVTLPALAAGAGMLLLVRLALGAGQ